MKKWEAKACAYIAKVNDAVVVVDSLFHRWRASGVFDEEAHPPPIKIDTGRLALWEGLLEDVGIAVPLYNEDNEVEEVETSYVLFGG